MQHRFGNGQRAKATKYVFLCGVAFEYDLVSNRTIAVAVIHRNTYRKAISFSLLYICCCFSFHLPRLFSFGVASEYVDIQHNKEESCIYRRRKTHSCRATGENTCYIFAQKVRQGWKCFYFFFFFTWLLCAHKIFEILKLRFRSVVVLFLSVCVVV